MSGNGCDHAGRLDAAIAIYGSTRTRLFADAERLDGLIDPGGTRGMGACPLFRTYTVEGAKEMQNRLANFHIWSRVFSYNPNWIRLGMPPLSGWYKLEAAI
jgi:cobalamin biosynthesis protein CobC